MTSHAHGRDNLIFTRAFADNEYGTYEVAVLKAALKATQEYGEISLSPHPNPMSQSRQLFTLLNGDADVMWSVTDRSREQKLLPIRLPLLKGYAGYRVFIINPARQNDFSQISDVHTLKSMSLVQGADWPDLAVLKSNGFDVFSEDWSLWFHSMYSMVDKQLVDGFPRNIIEVHRDMARHPDKKVAIEKRHLLSYPNYEFFFVHPDNIALANRLRVGLIRLLESGELASLFNQFEWHKTASEIANSPDRVVHTLRNPSIPYTLSYAQWDKYTKAAIHALKQELETNP
ncbi:transporter substrate-binding domain-containing protein [Alteromonas sp. D210916BOD_24]